MNGSEGLGRLNGDANTVLCFTERTESLPLQGVQYRLQQDQKSALGLPPLLASTKTEW